MFGHSPQRLLGYNKPLIKQELDGIRGTVDDNWVVHSASRGINQTASIRYDALS
jgi:hypothetical protein